MPAESVKSIFLEAVALHDLAARDAMVRERCGEDRELFQRVNALLVAHDRAASEGRTASLHPDDVTGDPDNPEPTADYPGGKDRIGAVLGGKYKLIEEIGEGGMGSVYMAQQTEPVKRAVAVKVIKAGMDSKAVLARFEAERQALAMMDHPNIAKVLDAGTTESGRPYFVMELVKGTPITKFCDDRKLTPRQRLELFVPVCNAIQHAHQKGVIHRDIKPSNVLVAMYDDRPVPKVIDFGVAKAAGQTLTDKTLMTGFGAVVGTPEYMSPEQASMNQLDVDTRSDVYSLGVLLFELLTGHTPVDRKSLGKAALFEVLRIVREVEAPKPSAKLSTIDTLPSVAANRGTEPAKLSKLMKGELDWVLLKALEKDRTRRYDTANGLARDIQRYLADEIVEARPPSAGYRLKKFVRRHKGQVMAGSLVMLALVAGVIGTTVGLFEARRQEGIAKEQEAEAKKQAGIARDEADAKERARADEAEQRKVVTEERDRTAKALAAERKARAAARRSLDDMTSLAVEDTLTRSGNLTDAQRGFLLKAIAQYEAFAAEAGDDLATQVAVANAHVRTGQILFHLGRMSEARRSFRAAHERFKPLATAHPTDWEIRFGEANAAQGLSTGHPKFEVLSLDAIALAERLVDDFRDNRAALQLLYNTLRVRAKWYHDAGRPKDALTVVERADPVFSKLDAGRQEDRASSLARAEHYALRLTVLSGTGDRPTAEEIEQQTVLFERAARGPGADTKSTSEAAYGRLNMSVQYCSQGNYERAFDQAQRAERWAAQLVKAFPGMPQYGELHGRTLILLGRSACGLHRTDALDIARRGVDIWEGLNRNNPTQYAQGLASNETVLAHALADAGKTDEAFALFATALARLQPIFQHARNAWTHGDLRRLHIWRGETYERVGKNTEALADYEKALSYNDPDVRAVDQAHRAVVRVKLGDVKEAVSEIGELTKAPKSTALQLYGYARVYAVASTKTPEKSAEYTVRAMELLRQAVPAGYTNAAHMRQDKALDALRDRRDFQKLFAEMAAKVAEMMLADVRKQVPKDSPQLALQLALNGNSLLEVGAFAKAEPLLRECLEIREKTQPDVWSTFNIHSMLGGALLGQKKYADAEPHLLKGYEGMKAREKTIPQEGGGEIRIPQALDRLIELYTAMKKPDEARKYRELRAKYPLEVAPPPRVVK